MELQAACHCGKVRYRVVSYTPYPYMRCYCSICRKTGGGGGYAINIMAQADSLRVSGEESVGVYRARLPDPDEPGTTVPSEARRHFCRHCGSALWLFDPRWRQWVYPLASAIDTPLPRPPETVHIMLDFAAPWVEVPQGPGHVHFPRYPKESILDWHKRHGLYQAP